MAPPTKKSVNQNDLRRLMKEHRTVDKQESKKIDSPLAKYDGQGNLSCLVCKVPIKNQSLWSSHLTSKVHRSTLESLKKLKQLSAAPTVTPSTQKRPLVHFNRPANPGAPLEKKKKIDDAHSKVIPVASQNILSQDYSSSDESEKEQNDDAEHPAPPASNAAASQLPPGFFDEPQPVKSAPSKKKENDPPDNSSSSTLPEGFFDDPILDAKVRKVEYKDPMDEEWDKFQKTITEETNVSQAIIEEDLVESTLEREIDEIDEQIHNWARVDALLQRKETISAKDARDDDSGGSSADEQGFEEYLDWRSKGVWKKS